MVAATRTSESPPASPATAEATATTPPIRDRSRLQRLLLNLGNAANLQYQIALLRAKLTVRRIALFVGLLAGAVVLGVLGVIFLYVAVYQILCFYMHPAFAFLILAGLHLIAAPILYWVGRSLLHGSDDEPPAAADVESPSNNEPTYMETPV